MPQITKETLSGILFIVAILAVVVFTELALLKDYEPPQSDRPGVFHLR
jgi:hypothetical protein